MFTSLSEVKIKQIILKVASGKTPGLEGLPIEFYKIFIDLLVPKFCYLQKEMFDKGILSPAFNETYIKVILKASKDRTQCVYYHPISFINIDTEIFNSSISNGLQQMITFVIKNGLVGLIKSRQAADNIIIFVIFSLDVETPFNKIHKEYMLAALNKFGFLLDTTTVEKIALVASCFQV